MAIDFSAMTAEQLVAIAKQATAAAKEKKLGIPTTDPDVVKLAGTVQNLAMKMGIDTSKLMMAIGRNFKEPKNYREYNIPDPNKPRKARVSKK